MTTVLTLRGYCVVGGGMEKLNIIIISSPSQPEPPPITVMRTAAERSDLPAQHIRRYK